MNSSLYRTSQILTKGLKKRNIPAGSVEYSVSNQAASFQYTNHSSDEVFWCALLSSSSIPIELEQSFPTRAGRYKMDSVNERGNKNKRPDLIKTLKQTEWYAHESESVRNSVVSVSLQHNEPQPTRLLRPWKSPDKNTGVGCHSLIQRICLTQGSNLGLRHCRQILYCLSHQGSPEVFLDKLDFALVEFKDHAYCTHCLSRTVTAAA